MTLSQLIRTFPGLDVFPITVNLALLDAIQRSLVPIVYVPFERYNVISLELLSSDGTLALAWFMVAHGFTELPLPVISFPVEALT
jgi:hypothetical protein